MADQPAGYEARDVDVPLVVVVLGTLAFLGAILLVVLWGAYRTQVPEAGTAGASPPVVMPAERPVADRLSDAGRPRLEGLDQLRAVPPSYRSSRPVPGGQASPAVHPEDLRADRQPRLTGYGWVDRGKGVVRIPIDKTIDIVAAQSAAGPKGGPP